MSKRDQQLALYFELRGKISECLTEDDIEKVSDTVDECSVAKLLTKGQVKSLENELDDKLMSIVEVELYGNSYPKY